MNGEFASAGWHIMPRHKNVNITVSGNSHLLILACHYRIIKLGVDVVITTFGHSPTKCLPGSHSDFLEELLGWHLPSEARQISV